MIPAYNAERTLAKTLQCVSLQDYGMVEVVLVNDGSTDRTEHIVDEWRNELEEKGCSVKTVTQENLGLLAARRVALELAEGEYLQFLDADDLIHPKKLSMCIAYLKQEGWDVVVPRTKMFKEDVEVWEEIKSGSRSRPGSATEARRASLTRHLWYTAGPVFRYEVVRKAGGINEDVHPVAEELEFHARIKLLTDRVKYIDDVLCYYRRGLKRSITSELRYVCEGRLWAEKRIKNMLVEQNINRKNEWRDLAAMMIKTYYRLVNLSDDSELIDRAGEQWKSFGKECPGLLKYLSHALKPRLVEKILVGVYRFRRRWALVANW